MARRKDPLELVRTICLSFPEVTERLSHGAPTWFVRDKLTIATFVNDHHGDGIVGIYCAAPVGVQGELVDLEPERFFVPPYVGGRGWLGMHLDRDVDAAELRQILADAYRQVAPKTLAAQLP